MSGGNGAVSTPAPVQDDYKVVKVKSTEKVPEVVSSITQPILFKFSNDVSKRTCVKHTNVCKADGKD